MDTTTKLKVGFAALMILSGIGVASYPVISNAVAQRHASEAIQNYDDTVKSMDTEKLDAAKEAARRYNQQLDSAVERDAAGEAEDTGTSYVDLVDVGESLGYITIPKIDVNCLFTKAPSDDVLQKGVGHPGRLQLPPWRRSTHSVLTATAACPKPCCSPTWTSWKRATVSTCIFWMKRWRTRWIKSKWWNRSTPRIWKSPRGRLLHPCYLHAVCHQHPPHACARHPHPL